MRDNNFKKKEAAAKETDKLIYITVAIMIVIMAVIVGATAASDKARRGTEAVTTQSSENHSPVTTRPNEVALTDAPESNSTPADSTSVAPESTSPVVAEAPELTAPVKGALIKPHSPDVLLRSVTMNDYRAHIGIDISAPIGEAVVCCADGIVKEVWSDPMMGRCVAIAHSGGLVTVMKNLGDTLAENIVPGRELKAGDTIGVIGETALTEIAEVPHLHFETELDGEYIDPMNYFASSVFADASTDYED